MPFKVRYDGFIFFLMLYVVLLEWSVSNTIPLTSTDEALAL